MEYAGNPNNPVNKTPEKKIEKVVTGEVILKPRSIRRKFRDVFFGGDLKDASSYVVGDVILPAIRDMLWDSISNGSKRMIYGANMLRRSRNTEYRPRIQYSNPINTTYRDPRETRVRAVLPDQPHPYRQQSRGQNDIILSQREDAEQVVERMLDILDKYEVVSLADLYDLLDQPSSHVDNKWGWNTLGKVEVRQVRDGYLIDLPPLEAI